MKFLNRFVFLNSMTYALIAGQPQLSFATEPVAATNTLETRAPTATEIYELRERCGQNARDWFKENFPPAEPIPVKDGRRIYDVTSGYENHYSGSYNRCYALVHKITSFSESKGKKGLLLQSTLLWDVNENAQLGAFVVKDRKEVTACNVSGAMCATKDEWFILAQPYLQD